MKIRLNTKKIYLAMAEKGLTVTEIAQKGGVSQQAVSNALNGNRVGKVKVVPAICAALGFKAQDIVIIEDQLRRRNGKETLMEGNCYDCSTCRYRYIHFPNMDDFEIFMQECLCDGEYYEEEQ